MYSMCVGGLGRVGLGRASYSMLKWQSCKPRGEPQDSTIQYSTWATRLARDLRAIGAQHWPEQWENQLVSELRFGFFDPKGWQIEL